MGELPRLSGERARDRHWELAGSVVFGATPVVPGATQVVSGATQVVSGATPVVSGATQVVSGATPVVSGATPVVSGATQVVSGATPVVSGATPVARGTTQTDIELSRASMNPAFRPQSQFVGRCIVSAECAYKTIHGGITSRAAH
jgi:hypothetical protein